MATKKVAKRGPGRPPKVVKRKPGRARQRKLTVESVTMQRSDGKWVQASADNLAAEVINGAAASPTAADLIAQLRPHIKGVDSVIAQCAAAGAGDGNADTFRHDATDLFERILLALARAP